MASSTVVPAAPAAPAASAPSAPAAPATPATPATPAPATPAPAAPAAPASGFAPAGVPATPAAPAEAPASSAAPAARPKPEDFSSDQQGVEDFIEANERWKQEHPDEAAVAAEADRTAAEAARPGAEPKAEAEAPKPEEKPAEAAPAGTVTAQTPQALDELLTRNAALKAALDASPADKEALMATARAAEAAKPILQLVPTVEEARFALDHANQFLGLQRKFALAAEMPEVGEQAFHDFVSLFHVTDDKGNVVKDAAGAPKLTESFDFLSRKLTTGALGAGLADAQAQVAALKKQVETGVYPSEAARAADMEKLDDAEYDIKAFDYVMKKLAAAGDDELQLPELPADATPAQRELQERLARQVEEANKEKASGSKAARIQARKEFEANMNQEYGRGIGTYLASEVQARKDRGEYIPDLVLNRKWIDPATRQQTDYPDFAIRMAMEFTNKVQSIPSVNDELMKLEAMGPAAKEARLARWEQLRAHYLPEIVDNYLTSVQNEVRQMSAQSTARQEKVATVARVEPQTTQQPAAPVSLQGDALEARAAELLANDPEYRAAGRSARWEMLMTKKEEIRAGRAR